MKRVLGFVLAVVMLLSVLPMNAIAEELHEEPELLPAEELPEMAFTEGMPYAGFASVQKNLPERGLYTLTLRRTGDISVSSAVLVSTVDISAAYGRDYIVSDGRWAAEEMESIGTVLENYADEASRRQTQETLDTIESLVEGSVEGSEESPADVPDDDAGAVPETGSLSLAELKELQSGMPVRETTESEFTSLAETFLPETNVDPAEYLPVSSATRVEFAPGEAEQTLTFRVLEDRESEGQEMFNFLLSAADDRTAVIEAAGSLSFVIEDDEPAEHSLVSFDADTYTAAGGFANITVRRTVALYSYVTVNLRAVENGSAAEGDGFEATDITLVFQSFQDEAVAAIPVAGGAEDTRFSVELYELRGAEAGEIMTAEVVIPAGCSAPEKEEPRVDDSYLDHFDRGGAAMGYTTSLELPQFGTVSIEYRDSANPNIGTIMSGKTEVGKYFATKTGNMYHIATGGPGDHPYSIKDDGNPYLYLEYYSSNIFRHGWTQGNYYVNEPANRYRMVLADLSTGSSYEDSRVGLIVETKKGGTLLTSESKEIGDDNARKPRLATALFYHNQNNYSPYPWSDNYRLAVYVKRYTNDLNRPSANVYGFVMLYREYKIQMVQPAAMAFRTGELNSDGTAVRKYLVPAQVSSATDEIRYTGQEIQINEGPASGNPVVLGTLTGYNIKPLEGTSFFYPTNSTTLTLDDNLIALIDAHTTNLQSVMRVTDGNSTLCRTTLTIQPVYKYRDVSLTLLPPTGLPSGAEYHYQDRDLEELHANGKNSSVLDMPNLLWDFSYDNAMTARMGANAKNEIEWTGTRDAEGNDYYVFTAKGGDPYVSIDLPAADASDTAWVRIRAKNLCQALAIELYGHTNGRALTGPECTHIDLKSDDEWHTYIVHIPTENVKTANRYKNANLSSTVWNGKVDWIRLDPMWADGDGAMSDGDQILIDYVAFFSSEEDAQAYCPEENAKKGFHVGDTLNLTMTASVEGAYFTQYSQYQYINPGDTAYDKNTSGDLDVRPNEVPGRTLFYTKNEVRGHFTDSQNYIRVELDENARRYFTVRSLVPAEQLAGTLREGENVLITDASGITVRDRYTPVTGRAYSVILDPTAANDGTWRPVITITGTGQRVNGFAADFIAANKAAENVISVTAEQIDPDMYEYFIIDGGVYYSAYSLRPQSEEVTSSPAMQAIITAGGASRQMFVSGKGLSASAERFTAITGDDGTFSIEGLRAVSGDTISVMADNNDMQQVTYIQLRSLNNDKFRRTASFDEIRPNPSTGENDNERVTASCAVNSAGGIDMPIRTYYSPYVSYVNYSYNKATVETRYNTVPIMEGNLLTLALTVVPNGADISSLTVIKVGRNGFKLEIPAVKTSGDGQVLTADYAAQIAADDLSDGDRFYVRLTAVPAGGGSEITYTALDTGLVCYTPKEVPPQQYFEYSIPNPYEKLPVVGSNASNLSSGKLTWKTVYADEKNKSISPYAEVVSLAFTVNDALFKANKAKLDAIKNGPSGSKSWDQMIADDNSNVFDFLNQADQDEFCEYYKENHPGATDEDAKNYFNSTPEWKEAFRDEITSGAKKDALSKTGDTKITVSVNVILQFEYDYDPVKNEHFFSGGQYIFAVCGNVSKTFYWTVYGVPVFLNISGNVSLQFDGRYVTDKGVTTAREMGYYDDLSKKVQTEWPWMQFGLGIKLQPGIGICGILGVRGILDFAFVARVNAGVQEGPGGGTMGTFTGGVGVDLLLFSFNYTIGSIGWKTGVFKSGGLQSDGMGEYYELRAFDPGEEYGAGPLRGVLIPSAKTTLINGAMEYIRPQLVDLGNGRTMLLFLRNMSGGSRDENNASALVYAVRNPDGTWEKDEKGNIRSVVVEEDGQADSTFDAVRVGSRVYIAWTNAQVRPGFSGDVDLAKSSLQSSNIHMSVYDLNGGTMIPSPEDPVSGVITVTDDSFVNSNVMLVREGDNIAVYYCKKDVGEADEISDLVGLNNNYITWARRVYDPALGQFIEICPDTDPRVDPTEELITIRHPLLTDPLVTDLTAADYSYRDQSGVTKDYRFLSYTIDRDGNQETASDRELWVQATNLTDGRSYYPIPIDANRSSILAPKLTKLEDDVYLTWLSDGVVYNTISAHDVFYGFDHENGRNPVSPEAEPGESAPLSSLARIRALSTEEIARDDWYTLPYQAARLDSRNAEWITMLEKLATCDLVSTILDFSRSVDYDGERTGMMLTDHQLVAGGDGNLYLFWTGQDNEDIENDFGRELYGAAMYRGNGEDLDRPSWSGGVKLTDYGKVIDELTVSVGSDASAILVGNLYTQDIAEDGTVVYSDHELAEIDFTAGNSLEIAWREIRLSDYYPVEGETVRAAVSVENNGLLPAERYEITVNGVTEIVDDACIYPGDSAVIERTFTAGADGGLTVTAEVLELDGTQKLTARENGANAASVSSKTGAVPVFGTAAIYSMPEEIMPLVDGSLLEQHRGADYETLLNLLVEPFEPEIQAVLRATTGVGTYADYIVCVPVTNIGNREGRNLKVTVTALEDTKTGVFEGDVLGETTISLLPVKEVDWNGNVTEQTVYAVIPLKTLDARKHLDEMGVLRTKISFTLDGAEIEETLHARRQLLRNQILEIGGGSAEINLGVNETSNLSVTAYPWDGLKNLVYSSQDPGVAIVSADGVIIGTGAGSTYIMIEDISSEPLYLAVKVNVTGSGETETDRTALEQIIEEAEAYEEKIAEKYPGIAAALKEAIDKAKAVDDSPGASQQEIDDAAEALTEALDAAKAAVAERLAAEKAEFERYKEALEEVIDRLARQDDSPICVRLAEEAGKQLAELEYDEGKTLGDNKAAADEIVDRLARALADQRAREAQDEIERENWLRFYEQWLEQEALRRQQEQNAAEPEAKENPFTDVSETDPYYGDVMYVYENGIMNGVSEDRFAPLSELTRGMIVTVLHRMEGKPAASYSGTFRDVPPDTWYTAGVEWAAANGIVNGYGDGTFGPSDPITREQLAAILYRYAQFKAYGIRSGDSDALDAADAESVSGWAAENVRWAAANGILRLTDGRIRPTEPATRAEIAAAIHAFLEGIPDRAE